MTKKPCSAASLVIASLEATEQGLIRGGGVIHLVRVTVAILIYLSTESSIELCQSFYHLCAHSKIPKKIVYGFCIIWYKVTLDSTFLLFFAEVLEL